MLTINGGLSTFRQLLFASRRPEGRPVLFKLFPDCGVTFHSVARESDACLLCLTEGDGEFQIELLPSITFSGLEMLDKALMIYSQSPSILTGARPTLKATRKSSRYTLSVLGGGSNGEVAPLTPPCEGFGLVEAEGLIRLRKYLTAPAVSPVV